MREIQLTTLQKEKAESLKEGPVLIAYLDGNSIRMETENGEDPYVWRNESWTKMRR